MNEQEPGSEKTGWQSAEQMSELGAEEGEQIDLPELIDHSTYVVEAYTPRGITDKVHAGTRHGGENWLTNPDHKMARLIQRLETYRSEDSDLQRFSNTGIPEVVTVTRLADLPLYEAKQVAELQAQSSFGEGAYLLMYETASRGDRRYAFADYDGRLGNTMRYRIILEENQAELLTDRIEQFPQTARNIGAMLMEKQGWDPNRQPYAYPPYEEWKEVNGGVNRIAVRDAVDKSPDESEILEF